MTAASRPWSPCVAPFTQGVVQPATVAAAASAALSPLWNWLYIVRLGLGLDGAALAVLSLQCTSLALVGGYTLVRNIRCPVAALGERVGVHWAKACGVGNGEEHAAQLLCLKCTRRALPQLALACVRTIPSPAFLCTAPRWRSYMGQEQAVWHGWSREAFREWGGYLALALPSVVMICCK